MQKHKNKKHANWQATDGATYGDDRLDVQKKQKKSMQSGKRPMEPLSEVHRTSTEFDTQASKETGKGPMEPPMHMTGLTCKKKQKNMKSGKRPMEPLSEVHRKSTDFDTQASKETGKGPMEPPMEMTDLTCTHFTDRNATERL